MDNNVKDNEQEIISFKNQLKEANEKLQSSINKVKLLQEEIMEDKDNLDRFQKVIDCLDTNIYWKNEKGVYIGCNIKIAELSNVKSVNDVIGKTDYDLSSREVADELRENDELVIETRTSVDKEEQLVLQSGKVIDLLAKKSPLIDSNGDVKGVIGVSIDITDRKKLEDKIKQKNEELKKKDEVKNQFIENFGHDIKVPINALVGRTQLLKLIGSKEKNEKLINASEAVENSTMVLDTLFTQMKEIIIHEQFDSQIYNTEFNLLQLVKKEFEIAESSISPNKHITIDLTTNKDLDVKICSDNYKLSQVMRNLLSNAVKYTDDGNINIKAEVFEKRLNQVSFKFMVSDTGIGIDKLYQKNIFDNFNRGGITSHNNNRHGMGVGLHIVKDNVEILGGDIDFESHLGQGSKFYLNLTLEAV